MLAAIGIIIGLIGAAIGVVAGAVGALFGIVLGVMGGCLGLLLHLFPVLLIAIGIIWLVKRANSKQSAGTRPESGNIAPPQSPYSPR
jgi:hypothetical protein